MDDLQDLGTAVLFTLNPNWFVNPSFTAQPMRKIINYRGTADVLQSEGALSIFSFQATYTLTDRTQKNYLLDFTRSHKGRLNRFWIRHPKSYFTLQTTAGTGSVVIYVDRNEFDWQFQGYERLYIQMGNGDIITRKIDSVIENVPLNRLEISFLPALDRDINVEDNNTIGRLYLVRFDQEDFKFKIITQVQSEVALRFVELNREYGSI